MRDFLRRRPLGQNEKKNKKKKVVVNLGCGSDVLPWQCLTRYPKDCEREGGVKFVDVDFPDLIERKRRTVWETEELVGAFKGVKEMGNNIGGGVVFDSEEYAMIGCDLRDLNSLRKSLESVVVGGQEEGGLGECEFVFVAEVSITYMEREGADGVIKWASSVEDGEPPEDDSGEIKVGKLILGY